MDNKDKLIKAQKELIEMFDKWVHHVKANELKEASELKIEADKKRADIKELEKKLKSKIITL